MLGVTVRTSREVVTQLRLGRGREVGREWGRVVFLIGAGCSATAGVPLGKRVAEMCAVDAAHRLGGPFAEQNYDEVACEGALRWLCEREYLPEDTSWESAYGAIFERLLADPTLQKQAIAKAVSESQGRINWTHMVLGHMVAQRYVSTVLTTNFDQLVLQGIILAGVLPVVADGVESLSRIDPNPSTPQVVHLHGSLHTYQMRNSKRDVQEIASNSMVISALTGLLHEATALVVVGYAGGEEGIMHVLGNAVRDLGTKNVFWVHYGPEPASVSKQAAELLRVARLGGVIANQDSDAFFKDLAQQLGIGPPEWLRRPIRELQVRAEKFALSDNADIRAEIDDYAELLERLAEAMAVIQKEQEEQRRVASAITEARNLRLKGRLEDALELLQEVANESPEVAERIGDLNRELAQATKKNEHLEAAKEAYDQALRTWTKESEPARWAGIQIRRGEVLRILGLRRDDIEQLGEALDRDIEAWAVFRDRGEEQSMELAKLNLLDDVASLEARQHTLAERRLDRARAQLAAIGIVVRESAVSP